MNPMASEFKLNPGAVEFVPCFGSDATPFTVADTTSQFELNTAEKCSQKQIVSSTDDTHVHVECERHLKGAPDVTPFQPHAATECLAGSHLGMVDRAKLKSSNLVRTSSKDSSAKSSTHTLPRIASGEDLADMELDFHEMILESPCDKEKCVSKQDDLNPLQIWCGEEPPQLVWSRSAEDLELPGDIIFQEESSDEQTSAPCSNDEADTTKRSQKQSRTTISSKGEKRKSISNTGEGIGETNGEDPVPQTKSKITVDDFEILCMVGEVNFL
jgi:hypothetical protein